MKKSATRGSSNEEGSSAKNEWIVTPGLLTPVRQFVDLYEMTRGMAGKRSRPQPIMICGDSGVGKSLFVHIVEQLAGQKVHRVNCAAFSDEVLESELFGHKKGAYTGAVADRKGHLLESHEGILVLEEIGDLSKRAQAKLLTFIEDGRFYPVGSEKEEAADVWIIGTTNLKQEVFRKDFWFRFFQFFVPPLHDRRGDVLYYAHRKFSEIVEQLRPWELLTLLAYQWPGNVRELERVFTCLKWFSSADPAASIGDDKPDIELFDHLSQAPIEQYSTLSKDSVSKLYDSLKDFGVPVSLLDKELNRYHLSLRRRHREQPLLGATPQPWDDDDKAEVAKLEKRLDVHVYPRVPAIDTVAGPGLTQYCLWLGQDVQENRNLLEIQRGPGRKENNRYAGSGKRKQLGDKIKQYLQGPEASEAKAPDLSRMTEDDVLRLYWTQVHKEVDGNQTAAGKVAGTSADTAKHRFEKYGIIPSKKNK